VIHGANGLEKRVGGYVEVRGVEHWFLVLEENGLGRLVPNSERVGDLVGQSPAFLHYELVYGQVFLLGQLLHFLIGLPAHRTRCAVLEEKHRLVGGAREGV